MCIYSRVYSRVQSAHNADLGFPGLPMRLNLVFPGIQPGENRRRVVLTAPSPGEGKGACPAVQRFYFPSSASRWRRFARERALACVARTRVATVLERSRVCWCIARLHESRRHFVCGETVRQAAVHEGAAGLEVRPCRLRQGFRATA